MMYEEGEKGTLIRREKENENEMQDREGHHIHETTEFFFVWRQSFRPWTDL